MVKTINLQLTKIRFVFIAGQIPIELKRIVEVLNLQMKPVQFLAIEMKEYVEQLVWEI